MEMMARQIAQPSPQKRLTSAPPTAGKRRHLYNRVHVLSMGGCGRAAHHINHAGGRGAKNGFNQGFIASLQHQRACLSKTEDTIQSQQQHNPPADRRPQCPQHPPNRQHWATPQSQNSQRRNPTAKSTSKVSNKGALAPYAIALFNDKKNG